MQNHIRSLLASLLLAIAGASASQAQIMSMKIQGYAYGGFDSWGNTFHIPGPPPYYTPGGIPYGMSFTAEFRYQLSAIGPDLDPSQGTLYNNRPWQAYWTQPSDYPAFLSASLTLNNITVDIDTRFHSVLYYVPFWNSLSVRGSADRSGMDPNGNQGAEGVSYSLNTFGQTFDPSQPGTYLPAAGYNSNGEFWTRIFQDNSPGFMSYYPPGRFTDGLYHWVEFYGITTRMDLSVVTASPVDSGTPSLTAVPEPSTYGLLGVAACICLGWKRRRGSRSV